MILQIRREKKGVLLIETLVLLAVLGMELYSEGAHRHDHDLSSYRRICYAFFKLMYATPLGKICASDHAMNAVDEMSALNRDMRRFFEEVDAPYEAWKQVEKTAAKYLK